jgi:general secretion pathway protein I
MTRRTRRDRKNRRGLTLFEIVLSLAILAGSLGAMANMIATGSRAATQSQLRTEAALMCETKLAEVMSGVEPMVPISGAPIVGQTPEWTWRLELMPGPHMDLLMLQVSVIRQSEDRGSDVTSSLVRYVRDPALFNAADEAALDSASLTGGE